MIYTDWKDEFQEHISLEAQTIINKDVSFRAWAAMHGGVYVPPTNQTPPNPYLDFLKDRDVITTEGKQLTLMNPAYMIREVMREYESTYGVKGHITSLHPINPGNVPDEWETSALKSFDAGEGVAEILVETDGELFYRKMIPLITREGCLKCHARQGYKKGDIRGGLSVTLPVTQIYALGKRNSIKQAMIFLAIFMLGLTGLIYISHGIKKREEAEDAFRQSDEKFKRSISYSPLPTVIAKPSGEMEYVNNRFTETLGYTIEDVRYPEQWWSAAYPDEKYRKDVISRWEKALEEARAKGEDIVIDTYNVTCKNGTVLTMEIWGTSIGQNHMIILQDITERMEAQKKIELWSDAINQAEIGIVISSSDGKYHDTVNPAYAKMHGFSVDEFVGMPIPDIFAPEARTELQEQIAVINETGHHSFKSSHIRKDGTVFPVLIDATAVKDEQGNLKYRVGNVQDITERMQAEDALRASEEKFSKIFHCSQNSIAITTLEDGTFIDANKGFEKLSGYTREEFIGKTTTELNLWLNPNERAKMIDILIKDGHVRDYAMDVHTKSGEIRYILMSIDIIEIKDKKYSVTISNDITERKQAEERRRKVTKELQTNIERMPIGYIFWDDKFKTRVWNKAAEQIFGYTSEEIIGQDPLEKIVPEDVRPLVADVIKKLLTGEDEANYSEGGNNIRKDGKVISCTWHNTPMKDENGNIYGVLSMVQDITERKLAENKIINSLKEKEVLLREVHHRVKNNMAVISSLLSLQSGYVDEKKYLDMFKESQSRIKSMALIHEKLYQSENFAHIDVQDYVRSLVENVRSSFLTGVRDVKLNINVEEINLDIDNLVPCGLLMNEVLTNAFKHAFDGIENPEITISMTKLSDGNISLSISDNGIGLPDGFDISKPAGLGLKLIKALTGQIEGTMEVNVDEGTEFRFVFSEKLDIARAD